jgi:hypothetical protein
LTAILFLKAGERRHRGDPGQHRIQFGRSGVAEDVDIDRQPPRLRQMQ